MSLLLRIHLLIRQSHDCIEVVAVGITQCSTETNSYQFQTRSSRESEIQFLFQSVTPVYQYLKRRYTGYNNQELIPADTESKTIR